MMNKENQMWVQKTVLLFYFLIKKMDLSWVKFGTVGLFLGLVLACGTVFGYNNLSLFAHPCHY